MKNKSFLFVVLALGFAGATSCGDDKEKLAAQRIENAALKELLAQQRGQTSTVIQTQTLTQTATLTRTATSTITATTTATTTATYRE